MSDHYDAEEGVVVANVGRGAQRYREAVGECQDVWRGPFGQPFLGLVIRISCCDVRGALRRWGKRSWPSSGRAAGILIRLIVNMA